MQFLEQRVQYFIKLLCLPPIITENMYNMYHDVVFPRIYKGEEECQTALYAVKKPVKSQGIGQMTR